VQVAVHPGDGVAGARQRRFLIVYRQSTISLAGLASDPANFLFPCTFAWQHGQLADDKRVCSNSIEQIQSTSAHESDGTNGSRCTGDLK